MVTAMIDAERLTQLMGQTYTIFTAKQQLYKLFKPCLNCLKLLKTSLNILFIV